MKNLKLQMTGICTSCANWQKCTLLSNNTSPVQQCEEFESSRETSQPEFNKLFIQKSEVKEAFGKANQVVELKGLCGNCTMSKSCSLSGKETGIWHCEEYM
jgi:hypothetical protein